MSLTAVVWLAMFLGLLLKGLSRPVLALCADLMTYFAAPQFWWWGKSGMLSVTMSWNLYAALAFAVSVGMHWSSRQQMTASAKRSFLLLALFSINAGMVHVLFASNPEPSYMQFDLVWKQAVLGILAYFAIQNDKDLRIFLIALFLGCAYLGFEVVVREAGSIVRGRLEGVRLPGASDSNGLSGLVTMGLLIGAYLFLSPKSKWWMKVVTVLGCVFILEVLLRCNSRGAFLAIITATCSLLFFTRGKSRKQIFAICLLGMAAVLLQAKDIKIWERFATTFASEEERDASADSRLKFWGRALTMIGDYPLGSGGEAAFNSDRGRQYIADLRDEYRAVHNGYLDIAAGWGVQGFSLLILSIGNASLTAFRVLRQNLTNQTRDPKVLNHSLLGAVLLGVLLAQMIIAMFISSLDNEWFYWCITLLLLYEPCCQIYED